MLAGNNLVRCSFGASCVLFAAPMYHNLGTAWASTLLAVLGCIFVPVPFLFYFLGDRIRMASKYALKVPCKPLGRSYHSKTSLQVGRELKSLCKTPGPAVARMPEYSVSYQPQSSAISYSAARPAPTLSTDAFYELSTLAPSTLLTSQCAAPPGSRSVNRGGRDIIDTMSGGRSPRIKN